jgi:hypothetical protein
MNKYGQAAIMAVNLIKSNSTATPLEAWNKATTEIMGEGTWAQKKGCPKGAFIGLSEAGLVCGIPHGNYAERTNSQKNKGYAIKAVQLLSVNPALANDKKALWEAVMNSVAMSHNYQMDVVLALWGNGLIERTVK